MAGEDSAHDRDRPGSQDTAKTLTKMRFGLALSGGGVRAMAFHLGVLRFLAERRALEAVSHVSTVSGGTLLMGSMMELTRMQWPRSTDFTVAVFDPMRKRMCESSLQGEALRQMMLPWNWVHLLSRANVLAKVLHRRGIKHKLGDLPVHPEWSLNGTTAENGRRFRFKRDTIGDYQFGYANGQKFPLAKAMAVSAAFPGGIGPLSLKTGLFEWKKRSSWDINAPEEVVVMPFPRVRLYDGGVYDNLGLEPYFDSGIQRAKVDGLTIYVSDAGAPMATGKLAGPLSPWRVKRLADIMSEQSRALRVRSFLHYLSESSGVRGAYVYLAQKVIGGNDAARDVAASFPTTLRRLTHAEFDAISEHGHAVAEDVERQHGLLEKALPANAITAR